MRTTARAIADAVGGSLVGPDVPVEGAAIDTRELAPGELFVAIVAERDGHDFVSHAHEVGAAAYLTAREPVGGTAIRVVDTADALSRLGSWARRRLDDRVGDRVVGVTGSVGKTTVKDMVASVLGERWATHASHRSFNNELGVPLTLFNAAETTEAVVVEMGARGVDHVAALCTVAEPTIGVVTTVGLAHTELFGTLDEVVRAKGELVEALPRSGTAVLNGDVPEVVGMAARTDARVVTFGFGSADVRAAHIHVDAELRPTFRLESDWGSADVALHARGEHQVANALAAAAVGLVSGMRADEVADGLAELSLSPWRMELSTSPSGAVVINDAYNANPASTEAALRALAMLAAERRTAVLGPMAELGDHAPAEHRRIAAVAEELGIRLIAVGELEYGTYAEQVADIESALEVLGPLGAGDAVLVKGSRVAGLERLAEALQGGG
jgi:UDP-N-acetylmuramoyl-tripeptide--D-alanyl-D-alanine ligase